MNMPPEETGRQLAELQDVFDAQRAAFRRQPNPPASERRAT